jgi:hypothetical protein
MKIQKLGGILLVIGIFIVSLRGFLGYLGGLIILLGAVIIGTGIYVDDKIF